MTTFGELKLIVIKMLGDEVLTGSDPISGGTYDADLLKYATHAALDAILPWIWKRSTQDLTGSLSQFQLPTDIYRVEAVWDNNTGMYMDPAVLSPGQPGSYDTGNAWYEFPEGYLTLYTALSESGGKLYYSSKWAKPEVDADILEIPGYVLTGTALWACSYCMLPKAALAADLGQYKRRMDSGEPTDNPLTDMSTYFIKRFDIEMTRLPSRPKGVLA